MMKYRNAARMLSIGIAGMMALAGGTGACSAAHIPATNKTAAVKTTASRAAKRLYLRNGDHVVFYGDSITDQRLYTTYVESYCVTRFPNQKFTFVHSGWGGDRVTGGGGGPIDVRLRRDVLAYKPTVVTICLGMNDAGYRAFDQGLFDTYVNGYKHIIETLKSRLPGVRITLLTAPAFDDVTRDPNFPGGYNATLLRYGQAVQELGRQYNLTVADTNAPLVAALTQAKAQNPTLAAKVIPDRVHPGPGGHLVMASALLKAWNAPETVADVEIDAAKARVVRHDNAQISNLERAGDGITFSELDRALPWPFDAGAKHEDTNLMLSVTDIAKTLNRYTFRVTGLKAASYILRVNGMDVATFSRDDWAKGVDLASLPNLPANVQAQNVLVLTRNHNDLHFQRWRAVQVPNAKTAKRSRQKRSPKWTTWPNRKPTAFAVSRIWPNRNLIRSNLFRLHKLCLPFPVEERAIRERGRG